MGSKWNHGTGREVKIETGRLAQEMECISRLGIGAVLDRFVLRRRDASNTLPGIILPY